jgi:hypothetical protein
MKNGIGEGRINKKEGGEFGMEDLLLKLLNSLIDILSPGLLQSII